MDRHACGIHRGTFLGTVRIRAATMGCKADAHRMGQRTAFACDAARRSIVRRKNRGRYRTGGGACSGSLRFSRNFRNTLIDGDVGSIAPVLVGGREPEKRLAIHQRNYETSLVDAMLTKFPATGWLVGTPFLTEVARRFVHEHPPQARASPSTARVSGLSVKASWISRHPVLKDFAELEWHIGLAAIAVDALSISADAFSNVAPEMLPTCDSIYNPDCVT